MTVSAARLTGWTAPHPPDDGMRNGKPSDAIPEGGQTTFRSRGPSDAMNAQKKTSDCILPSRRKKQ